MKNKKELDRFISTLMYSWSTDTPPEAIWAIEVLWKKYNVFGIVEKKAL